MNASFRITLISMILCLAIIFSATAEKQIVGEMDAADRQITLSLADITEIYPVVELSGTDGDDKLIVDELEDLIESQLTKAGLKVAEDDLDAKGNEKLAELLKDKAQVKNIRVRSIKTPELIVRIAVAQSESGKAVYHVQTSLARRVYMKASVRSAGKAEVWRIDRPIGFADANSLAKWVKSETTGQVDAFIAAWQKANTKNDSREKEKSLTPTTTGTTEYHDPTAKKVDTVKSEYVASKNSKVFHKSTCPSAKRISSGNLISFRTRDEAVQSGRRPCKICKP